MIVDERMVTYIRSLERPENPVIEAIEQEALENFVPIIRKETQSFLKVMMLMNRPARVLEVGTAVAFSPSFADVPPFAGRRQADTDQFSFYPL